MLEIAGGVILAFAIIWLAPHLIRIVLFTVAALIVVAALAALVIASGG